MPFLPSPDMEEVGEATGAAFDLKGVMDWDTPEARVNCSLSSTLVRPLAAKGCLGLEKRASSKIWSETQAGSAALGFLGR